MTTPPPDTDSQEVLIAEDSPTQALLLHSILERHGFHVTVAVNGARALDALATLRPALVISDIQMPEMDGYELCRRIKADAARHEIPVMLLTSLSAPEDIIQGLACGADNFVVKPYQEEFLMARIRTVLSNCRLKRTTGEESGIAVDFAGQRYIIDSSRRQILNLLLSTYETAVKTNSELIEAHRELKAAQAQLIEAEKLQSVGRLAAGVAHEVKNPLAIMEMGLAFLSDQAPGEDAEMILGEMREAVQRANGVITSLMDIASPRELGMREAALPEVIERALLALQEASMRAEIEVVRDFAADLPSTPIDAAKVEQVFVNVFANAIDAMPGGGTLTIHAASRTLAADEVGYDVGDRSGVRFRDGERAIVIEVRDTGGGITPANLTKIFEPFFSTKPTGKGMGLGLPVARKLMELHRGTLTVRNGASGSAVVTMMFKTT